MTRSTLVLVSLLALSACQKGADNQATTTNAEAAAGNIQVGKGTIRDQIGQATDLSRFADALKAAGLDKTLDGPGPYTVFAPTNAAFDKLPPGTADGLMQAGQKAQLTELLTAHIVPGAITANDLGKAIDDSGGKAQLATIGGGTLTVTRDGDALVISDASGGMARVVRADALQTNGALHAIDAVLQPAS